jgi:DNA-binding transcriptional ArsR family regulator
MAMFGEVEGGAAAHPATWDDASERPADETVADRGEVGAQHGVSEQHSVSDQHSVSEQHSVLHSHAGVTAHAHVEVVQVLRALAEPARLSVVHLLAEAPRRVTDLTGVLGLAQSTVSGHLAVLREAGLVTATPQGRSTWYALVDAEVDGLLGAAERVVSRLAAS